MLPRPVDSSGAHEHPWSGQQGSTAVPRTSLAGGLLRLARPKQWLKNVLVVAAPGAAGVLFEMPVLTRTAAAFGLFCLTASGAYFLNDVVDVEVDRAHPEKQHRPVAAGVVPVGLAIALAFVLLAGGLGLASVLAGWQLVVVLGVYVALQPLYSLWLKHQPVVDLAVVASGFVLRAVAGAVATDVPISQWFLIVASFGSLFMVAGKRHAEHLDLGEERTTVRATLGAYSPAFLRYVRSVSSSVAIGAYCLWAFERSDEGGAPIFFELSIVPFVLAILRYALLLEQGHGGAPEDVVLRDRPIQVFGLLWVLTFALAVHGF